MSRTMKSRLRTFLLAAVATLPGVVGDNATCDVAVQGVVVALQRKL